MTAQPCIDMSEASAPQGTSSSIKNPQVHRINAEVAIEEPVRPALASANVSSCIPQPNVESCNVRSQKGLSPPLHSAHRTKPNHLFIVEVGAHKFDVGDEVGNEECGSRRNILMKLET